jgi:hypothetical protein
MAAAVCTALRVGAARTSAPTFSSGQNIAPAYEGWERNEDGSFNLVFGYLNRNWDEAIHLPAGPNNRLEPKGPDRGQPTYFLPRRNFFVFRVRVPADFGEREVVWTLTSHGRTERAFATLRPGYALNDDVMTATLGAVGPGVTTAEVSRLNRTPALDIEPAEAKAARVGEPLLLTAHARDDGHPVPMRIAPFAGSPVSSALGTLHSVAGLRVAWFVYQGVGEHVTFDPPQFKVYVDTRGGSPWAPGWTIPPVPADNRWNVSVTFDRPGTYVLRCIAHDGALATHRDVTVTVTGAVGWAGSSLPGRFPSESQNRGSSDDGAVPPAATTYSN